MINLESFYSQCFVIHYLNKVWIRKIELNTPGAWSRRGRPQGKPTKLRFGIFSLLHQLIVLEFGAWIILDYARKVEHSSLSGAWSRRGRLSREKPKTSFSSILFSLRFASKLAPRSNKKAEYNCSAFLGRDDWIRTSDHAHPMRVRYQTAPHPGLFLRTEIPNSKPACRQAGSRIWIQIWDRKNRKVYCIPSIK